LLRLVLKGQCQQIFVLQNLLPPGTWFSHYCHFKFFSQNYRQVSSFLHRSPYWPVVKIYKKLLQHVSIFIALLSCGLAKQLWQIWKKN
jgi:hypothetical protein